ncbi:MAG: PKD domain-containing protein [Actinomycetota bacterium]|nr:PKD domain-containing protein [Actinomycetota bacterium]
MTVAPSFARILVALLATLALVVGASSLATRAAADTAPVNPADPATPPTVSADPLPTVQIDGVVWDQVVVGNTVYAGGRFSNARPAGAAPGTQLTPRNNLLAYDLTTGNLLTSFAPDLNAQVLAVTASPDGTRVYVGGDFTLANGQVRNRIAAYDTATGALIFTFRSSVFGPVRALTATNTTVYVGGTFTAVGPGGQARKNLAAFDAASGAVLPWTPTTQEGINQNGTSARTSAVQGIVVLPALNKVVAVGRFGYLNGVRAIGVGALDATTGATLPFATSTQFTNDGDYSAFLSVSTDGTNVYGTAYDFYDASNFEGTFAARASDGGLNWVADCKGDHYQAFRSGSAIYSASHAHNCSLMRAFPEINPRPRHAHAVSLAATTTVTGGWLVGKPAPTMLAWAPDFTIGTFTGQSQGPWSVDGNSQYVVYAGEFTYVNATRQQGLVRFAVARLAPNQRGPKASTGLTPTLSNPAVGTARVTWQATYDQDNENLTYRVVRNGNTAAPIYVTTVASKLWSLPSVTFDDVGLPTGTYTYQIYVVDPFGNQNLGAAANVVVVGLPGTANSPPTAGFTHTTNALTASFDATGSTDTDGTINSYAWTFGDGSTASGATASRTSRTYATPGTYSVQLTVTDNDGATGFITKSVTVAAAGGPLASDAFSRSVAGGLGTADAGGPWTASPAAACSVNGSAAVLSTGAGVTVNASLNGISVADTAVQVAVALDRATAGAGNYVSVVARKVGGSDYRVRLRVLDTGVVNATLFRSVNGTLTELRRMDIPGLIYSPGLMLNVRFDVSGSGTSTLRAKVWAVGVAEPGWQLTATDATASLQGPGAVGVATYVSSTATNGPVRISFDKFWAGAAGTAPPA